MLDEINTFSRNKVLTALNIARDQCRQLDFNINILNKEHDNRDIKNIIFVNSDNSMSAGFVVEVWLEQELRVPFIINNRNLPKYASKESLIILSDYLGSDQTVFDCLNAALTLGCQLAIISSGGRLIEIALDRGIAYVPLVIGLWPKMTTFYEIRAIAMVLSNFNLITSATNTINSGLAKALGGECAKWASDTPTANNYPKQLACGAVGKSAVFYGGQATAPIARVFQDRWGVLAKNVAFSNNFTDFGSHEATSWLSLPIEKPFSIFNIVSNFETDSSHERFHLVDRLLSGKRPKSIDIQLEGDCLIAQLLWGVILADFSSIYLAALNNVNPMDDELAVKIDKELSV